MAMFLALVLIISVLGIVGTYLAFSAVYLVDARTRRVGGSIWPDPTISGPIATTLPAYAVRASLSARNSG